MDSDVVARRLAQDMFGDLGGTGLLLPEGIFSEQRGCRGVLL